MPRNRRKAGHEGNQSQSNPTVPQPPTLQDQSYNGHPSQPVYSNKAEQINQVDSWRSYPKDGHTLQSSILSQPYQVLGSNSTQPNMNARAPTFTPYQPLRVTNGTRERQAVHQVREVHQAITHRYPLRNLNQESQQPTRGTTGNWNSIMRSRDQPLPSIEQGYVPFPASNTLVPSSLPPRAGDRRSRTPAKITPPKRPVAAGSYLKRAGRAPEVIASPKKLLVILDLNGTLLVRPNSRGNPKAFKLRPGVTPLLDYLFDNHVVMVYSSARPENVKIIVENLFHPKKRAQLAGIWARDKLDLNAEQYFGKVQVYKKLDKIWADKIIQKSAGAGQRWDQTNTVLVDDSRLKALAQPHNLIQVIEFENNAPREGDEALRAWNLKEMAILKSLEQKLEQLKMQVDVSRLIREWQSGKRLAPGVVDETIDQKTQQTVPEQLIREGSTMSTITDLDSESTPQPANATYSSTQSQQASYSTNHGPKATTDASALDILDAQIDNAMKNTSLSDSSDRGSESPIDESVFTDLLRPKIHEVKDMPKKSTIHVPPTLKGPGGK